jgi:hypothetical protein
LSCSRKAIGHSFSEARGQKAIQNRVFEAKVKTDLEEVVRYGIVDFLMVGAALSRIRSLRLFQAPVPF